MQTNHASEQKKSPILWIIILSIVLLAGAFVFYSRYMQTRQAQAPAAVVARGKIPPPPLTPAVESAPTTDTGGSGEPTADERQSDPGSPQAVSTAADSRESTQEMKSESAAPAHEEASAESGMEPVAAEAGASEDQVSVTGPGDGRPITAPADEAPAAGGEAEASPAPNGTVASPLSGPPAAEVESAPMSSPSSAPEAAAQYTIQV